MTKFKWDDMEGVDWYSTAAHEMHHRRPDKNFASLLILGDGKIGFEYTDVTWSCNTWAMLKENCK